MVVPGASYPDRRHLQAPVPTAHPHQGTFFLFASTCTLPRPSVSPPHLYDARAHGKCSFECVQLTLERGAGGGGGEGQRGRVGETRAGNAVWGGSRQVRVDDLRSSGPAQEQGG
eukprot:752791-Rhodomonas_salina.1